MEDINLLGRSVILRSGGVRAFRSRGGAEELRSQSRGGGRCGALEAASHQSSERTGTPGGFHPGAFCCREN